MSDTFSFAVRLIRHAETDANRLRRVEAASQTPLNELGRRQALALHDALLQERADKDSTSCSGQFVAVYSSDICRALETCKLVFPDCQVHEEPLLRERKVGALAGRDYDEVKTAMAAAFLDTNGDNQQSSDLDGLESRHEIEQRLETFLQRLTRDMRPNKAQSQNEAHRFMNSAGTPRESVVGGDSKSNYTGEVAVFTHAGIIHCLLTFLSRQYGLLIVPPHGLEQLPFCANTSHTRLKMEARIQDSRLMRVTCDFLHKDAHLMGDIRPSHHLMPDLSVRPRQ